MLTQEKDHRRDVRLTFNLSGIATDIIWYTRDT